MGKSNRFAFVYLIIGVMFLFGWQFIQNAIWPPPPNITPLTPKQTLSLVGGELPLMAVEIGAPDLAAAERKQQANWILGTLLGSPVTVAIESGITAEVAAERRKQAVKQAPHSTLYTIGNGEKSFHIQGLLTTQGGSIQQIVLSDFQEASRMGLPVYHSDGTKKPLHLIPGVRVPRTLYMKDQAAVEVPELTAGPLTLDAKQVEHPSYVMYHYEREGDLQPVETLGTREWRVVRNVASEDSHTIAFEIELGAPFFVRITKTFTLGRKDYHLGLSVSIVPWNRPADARVEPFRYQIAGPRAMPIEGEWYTSVYRTGVVGFPGSRGLEDPRQVVTMSGSDKYEASEKKPIRYAGVMLQYFAAVLAVDNQQSDGQGRDFLHYVRFTPVGDPVRVEEKKTDLPFLHDLTFRAVSKPVDVTLPVTHSYVLYHGPVKVRLLKQLEGEKAVPEETVNRYRDDLNLSTLTDAPMPNWLGRFANFIFWTDIVIFFTNLIHSILGVLTHVVPNLGLCVIIITIAVRGLLHPLSRRQMINAKIMQAKQEKLAPDLKKLIELHGSDFNKLNQEKMKLYKEHGINPAAALGGCLPLLLQMPIFMGLYYALQESVFFRLESIFGDSWIPNLAAPDMLLWWTEQIPFLSTPDDLGAMLYIGPFLNLLPLISVGLMMYVQSKMMPKSDDPQVQMQQKTMKFMMIIMLFFFYKVAAGLCIYFICSSVWGMIERKLIPKKIAIPGDKGPGNGPKDKSQPTEPKGWLGKKKAAWKEKWERILEEAAKQQNAQKEKRPEQSPGQQGNENRKKKKKR